MKTIILLLIITGISTGQIESVSSSDNNIVYVKLIKAKENTNYLYNDLNFDGNYETLSGNIIINTGKNEYWVKNAELRSSNGTEIRFDKILDANDKPVIEQVKAVFGYIIVFEKESDTVEIYIADMYGKKNSDAIILNF